MESEWRKQQEKSIKDVKPDPVKYLTEEKDWPNVKIKEVVIVKTRK